MEQVGLDIQLMIKKQTQLLELDMLLVVQHHPKYFGKMLISNLDYHPLRDLVVLHYIE